jgi:hypothetical protein
VLLRRKPVFLNRITTPKREHIDPVRTFTTFMGSVRIRDPEDAVPMLPQVRT